MLLNPANEKLRNEISGPPNVKDILDDILLKTKNIHVSYLFAHIGTKLLKNLALCLLSTNNLMTNDWKDLAHQLKLDPLLPRCIQNYNIMNQDPLFTTLVAYTQKEDATIGKVYEAIYEINRLDAITYTVSFLNEFYDEICKKYVIPEEKILKPSKIPEVPVILKNIENIQISKIVTIYKEKNEEIKCKSEPIQQKKKYDKLVLLSYCESDSQIAQKVANEFRKERNGQRIGVILLEEHRHDVCAQREQLVTKFYTKAHYVVVIASIDYLNAVSDNQIYASATDNMDHDYIKFIYNTFVSDYVRLGCKNKNVRGIILDEQYSLVNKHYVFKNPVFRTWVLLSEISNLAEKILTKRI